MTVDLTAARIRRAARRLHGPAIDEKIAHELAAELEEVIREACAYCAAQRGYSAADTEYITRTMLREIIDDHPPGDCAAYDAACVAGDFETARLTDYNAACNTSMWLAWELTEPGDQEGLYQRYMRLWCRINGGDYDSIMGTGDEDECPSDGVVLPLEGVTLDEEVVFEEEEDINGDRARRRRRRPQLVTEPEAMSNEDMNRLFLQLMGEQS
jgi:hypothetical protein